MIYGSVCSGIEAATVAWHPLGWTPAFFSEIEAAPSAVLAHHHPGVRNLGDFTRYRNRWTRRLGLEPIDLLVGGTPCQSFSVAGLRGGLADARGNLALEFLRLARRARARWVVWENVPGVLSSSGGRDFGAFLGALGELGYGWAYRVLDAQHFGVPQRRRRVFVVGHLGDWRRAAAVLFERHGLSGDPPPRREARAQPAAFAAGGLGNYREGVGTLRAHGGDCHGGSETLLLHAPGVAFGLQASVGRNDNGSCVGNAWNTNYVAHTLRGEGFDASEDGTGLGTPLVPVFAIQEKAVSENVENGPQCKGYRDDGVAYTLEARTAPQAVAQPYNIIGLGQEGKNHAYPTQISGCLQHKGLAASGNEAGTLIQAHSAVRRLTPIECERLQGFPDDHTLVPYRGKPMADGPRYKMLGNSMAVPVMAWIGRRIQAVEGLPRIV